MDNMEMTAASREDDLDGRFLLFDIDETLYSIALRLVIEIIKVQSITQLPGVPGYIKGIINLRGGVVPVIDVRLKFGLPERPIDDKTCIIVVVIHDMHIGLMVDNVNEVVTIEPARLSPPPSINGNGAGFLSSVAELGDRVILDIDCEAFFQSDLSEL